MTNEPERLSLTKTELHSILDKILLEIEKLKDIQRKQESILYQKGDQT